MKTLRAAFHQATSDLRPQILGVGFFMFVGPVLFILIMLRRGSQEMIANTDMSSVIVAGMVGSFSSLILIQISFEHYSDRLGGALVRTRVLPNGARVWAIGKTISCVGSVFVMQALLLVAAVFLLPHMTINPAHFLAMLLVALLANISAAPLGIAFGSLLRGAYSQLLSYGIALALFFTSGIFISLADFPRGIQLVQLALPFYWSGHLSRWVADYPAQWELGGEFSPLLATGVLTAWTVVGFIAATALLRYSFRKETFGSLASIQSTARAQLGM